MNTYIPEQSNANLRLVCEYIYDPELGDPENGIEPGTSFEDLPADWVCPLCGVGKEDFEKTH